MSDISNAIKTAMEVADKLRYMQRFQHVQVTVDFDEWDDTWEVTVTVSRTSGYQIAYAFSSHAGLVVPFHESDFA